MTDATKVWMPDTFFRNEKIGRFHKILQDNLYVRVFPDGDVLYSIRVSLTCACSMHLALFPLDKQTCNLDVASCKFKVFEFLSVLQTAFLRIFLDYNSNYIINVFCQMAGQRMIQYITGKELAPFKLPKALTNLFLEDSSLITSLIFVVMLKLQLVISQFNYI